MNEATDVTLDLALLVVNPVPIGWLNQQLNQNLNGRRFLCDQDIGADLLAIIQIMIELLVITPRPELGQDLMCVVWGGAGFKLQWIIIKVSRL